MVGNREPGVALYARVSTTLGQSPEMQLAELRDYVTRRGWKVYREYVDYGISGAHTARPQLNRMMRDAHERRFDILLCWKLDRLSRSLKDLVTTLDDLNAKGIAFVSLRDAIDLSTPSGRLMMHMIAAMAEFERSLIQERVKAGLAHARTKGIQLGRPQRIINGNELLRLRAEGRSLRYIARTLGVGYGTVRKRLARLTTGGNP